MCFTNVNEAGIRYRYFMYSTNKCTDFNKNITKKTKKTNIHSKHIPASMNYFDSDMSNSTNTAVYFDRKTVIYIYVCGQCRTQFMLPNSSSQ